MLPEEKFFRIVTLWSKLSPAHEHGKAGSGHVDITRRAELLCRQKGWELVGLLGGGRTSLVFEVRMPAGSRALKMFLPAITTAPARRHHMAAVVNRLKDCDIPHLMKVEEGEAFIDNFYIVMRLEQGRRLSDRLACVPPSKVNAIFRQIAAAAYQLQKKGVLHGDLNCENVLISEDWDHAVLIDIAFDPVSGRYSSPELAFGLEAPGPRLTQGLTFYQLGALLHDLIMRKPLYQEVVQAYSLSGGPLAYAIATQIPRIESETVSEDLLLLARRALDKDLTRRLASVGWSDLL